MKKTLFYYILVLGILSFNDSILAQQMLTETFIVDLSEPAERAFLRINLNEGTVKIKGFTNRQNIEIQARVEDKSPIRRDTSVLKKVPNLNFELDIKEDNNLVDVVSHTNKMIYLDIKIPMNLDLELNLYNDCEGIEVDQVNGDLSIKTLKGQILLNNISGSVNATIQSGYYPIKATLLKVNDKPMAFSSFSGDIEVVFPQNMAMTAHLSSDKGGVYSDFNLEKQRTHPIQKKNKSSISVMGLIQYKINGGGPDLICKSINGDIIIRKL